MGRDEQEGGALFVRLWSPTDLDTASEAMRIDLKEELGIYDEWKYLGVFGGTLRDFLERYIDVSHALKKSYSPVNKRKFYDFMIAKWGYDKETLDLYFSTLVKLTKQKKIPKSIYEPYSYVPDDSTVPERASKYLVKAIIIGGISYLLIKSIIFSGPSLISKYSDPSSYKRKKKR